MRNWWANWKLANNAEGQRRFFRPACCSALANNILTLCERREKFHAPRTKRGKKCSDVAFCCLLYCATKIGLAQHVSWLGPKAAFLGKQPSAVKPLCEESSVWPHFDNEQSITCRNYEYKQKFYYTVAVQLHQFYTGTKCIFYSHPLPIKRLSSIMPHKINNKSPTFITVSVSFY